MKDQTLIVEMENLLYEKLKRMDLCLSYYELIHEDVRHELLKSTFNQIDDVIEEIQNIDLVFLSTLDRYKKLLGVKSLEDLTSINQKAFELIQKSIALITQKQKILDDRFKQFEPQKISVLKQMQNSHKINKSYSAYRNINK